MANKGLKQVLSLYQELLQYNEKNKENPEIPKLKTKDIPVLVLAAAILDSIGNHSSKTLKAHKSTMEDAKAQRSHDRFSQMYGKVTKGG